MTIRNAATHFSTAASQAEDPAVATIARGLQMLATSLARELEKLEREIQAVKSQTR